MDLAVQKSPHMHGTVRIPPNKSHSFRALIMAGLAEGVSRIIGPAVSNDWMRGIEALEMLGAKVDPKANHLWEITGTAGQLKTPDDVIDCGNSGIILRFFMGLAACCEGYTVLSGDESIRRFRVCQPLIDAIVKEQEPIRERAQPFLDDPTLVRNIVADGCERARKMAEETMRDVRGAMGLDYT